MAKSIYYQQPYQSTLVWEIKRTINETSRILLDPGSPACQKTAALYRLLKIIPVIINDMPEPTIENVGSTNHDVQVMVRIYERFFRCLRLPSRVNFLKAFAKLFIIVMSTDFYRPFIRWLLWEIKKSDLEPLGPFQPDPHYWNENAE